MPVEIDSNVMKNEEYIAKRKRIDELKVKFKKAQSLVKAGIEGTSFLGGYNPGDTLSIDQTLVKLTALYITLIECLKE